MPELVIVTGMSGAGKTLASHVFEDLNFYCIDNLPPDLMPDAARLWHDADAKSNGLALIIDSRAGGLFSRFVGTYDQLKSTPVNGFSRPKILYLDASDDVLVKRFKETRRKHPLVTATRGIMDSIRF
ncbi:MAG: RNase adapter RapZ, partial [Armatimonadota bacterium]